MNVFWLRMTAEESMRLCEEGRARIIYGDVLLMKTEDKFYLSLDGNVWEETESEVVRKEFE